MDFQLIAIISLLALMAVSAVYNFIKMGRAQQLNKVKEWLLYAVVEAERELGSKTGQLKLRYVYDLFMCRFKFGAYIISFDTFSRLVDEALDEMKDMINKINEE